MQLQIDTFFDNMKRIVRLFLYIMLVALISACSANRFIPENHYLLDEVNILSDTKEVNPSLFTSYVRQNPNAKWFNLVKVPMHIYCLSGQDSTSSFNRFLKKLGDEPVINDPFVTEKSQIEIEKAVRNMGYMRAKVHLNTETKKNKLKVNYLIEAGQPYTVKHIAYNIDDMVINDYIEKDSANSYLHEGMPFDVSVLDNERNRITKLLQNNGYYRFNKDFLVYQADTVKNTFQVNLTMKLLPFQLRKEDIPTQHKQYTIRNVNFLTEDNLFLQGNSLEGYDSIHHEGLRIFYKDNLYLRPNVLADFNYIQPQKLYREQDVQNTYTSMGRLRALKYTNINFSEVTRTTVPNWTPMF